MKKATIAILMILSILIGFFNHKWWISIVLISLILVLLIFRFARTSKKGKYRSAFKEDREEKELEKRKLEMLEAKKKAELKLERMEETDCLIWSGFDITVDLSNLDPKQDCILEDYENLFGEYVDTIGKSTTVYPPIDPIFNALIKKDNGVSPNHDVRIFKMKERNVGHSPIYYIGSFKKDPSTISMSAKSILNCFIIALSTQKTSKRNWFVLNTKYPATPSCIDDVKIVDIRYFEKTNKLLLYCYPYERWSSFGGWVGIESTFFIPLLINDKVKNDETIYK